MQSEDADFFLMSGDPLIYNTLRECRIIRTVYDQAGTIGWLVRVDPSIPLLRFLGNGATETVGETAYLGVFGGDPEHLPVISANMPTKVYIYAIASSTSLKDGKADQRDFVLYPPSLLHRTREAALQYSSPVDEERIRNWIKFDGPR